MSLASADQPSSEPWRLGGGGWDAGFTLWVPLHQSVPLLWQGEPMEVMVEHDGPDRMLWHVAGADVAAERVGVEAGSA